MGTVFEITVQHKNPAAARKIIQEALLEGERIENLLSVYKKASEVSIINLKAGVEEVKVSEDCLYVIEEALSYSKLSNGAFDITVGPLIELWGFNSEEKKVPYKTEIKKTLPLVNYKNVRINREKSTVKLKKRGMKIDLGGIAKGYAVDRMAAILKNGGIKRAIVNAGGDVYALGNPARKSGWEIGIRNPRNHESIVDVIRLSNKAAATSGDYEKFFTKGGRRYSHIIDPRIGAPASSGVMSITVIAPSALEADALATTLFVLGEKAGKELIGQLEDVEAFFVK
jgi:thiamine biosynthesis lipoprotein